MDVEFTVPDHAAVIERVLDGFIQASELLIRAGAVPWRPPLELVLQDDDVQRFQLPTETAERLTGDCEDIVIWWAGGLRATGKHPRARARIKTTGPKQVHCLLDLGNGTVVDIYQEHLDARSKSGFKMGGWWSSLKHAASSVGHGIASAARGVAHGAEAVGRDLRKGAGAVGDAAHYVAHDLPGDIIHEATSGLKDVAGGIASGIRDVGQAGSSIVNAAGDTVAGGLQDALHQVGKLGGALGSSFSGGFGDDVQSYNGGGDDGGGEPPDAGAGAGAYGDMQPASGGPPPPDWADEDLFDGADVDGDDGGWNTDDGGDDDGAGGYVDG